MHRLFSFTASVVMQTLDVEISQPETVETVLAALEIATSEDTFVFPIINGELANEPVDFSTYVIEHGESVLVDDGTVPLTLNIIQ